MALNIMVTRISTNAIENEISNYSQKEDAIGFIYQQGALYLYCPDLPDCKRYLGI